MATENTGANENKKAGEAARKPRPADGKTPVKKKKIIIVTGKFERILLQRRNRILYFRKRKKAQTGRSDRCPQGPGSGKTEA